MYQLNGKRVLLGITGGIAAYKSALLVRLLRQSGAEVRVVMTNSATEFVTPLTFQALSGDRVYTDLRDPESASVMQHIALARWADLIMVAPASANFIARYANGFADDLLSTLCLAADSAVAIAPAMNQQMWYNRATRENIAKLASRQVSVFGPAEGDQACGETGFGRMLEPEQILELMGTSFETALLAGTRCLITAGPTHEAIDPVRYISNRSSGRMGYAIATAAAESGAEVSIISGPVDLPSPARVAVTRVTSAREMYRAVMQAIDRADIFIAAAAVADYCPESVAEQKIKKSSAVIGLRLKQSPDILAGVTALHNAPFTLGFAAETGNLEHHALQKLRSKNLDMIAANRVGNGVGFEADVNALTVYWQTGKQYFDEAPKTKLARRLVGLLADRYHAKNTNQAH